MAENEDIETSIKWQETLLQLRHTFANVEDVKDIVFLIGLQELGQGYQKLTKDQKVDVMHIGVCHLLSPYGYYEYDGKDAEGWPHWKQSQSLPPLTEDERELLLKRAIIDYFESR